MCLYLIGINLLIISTHFKVSMHLQPKKHLSNIIIISIRFTSAALMVTRNNLEIMLHRTSVFNKWAFYRKSKKSI